MVKALPDLSLGEYEKRKLKIISSLGSVYKFRPFLDGAGILRVGGRLQNSSSDYQSKHKLLFPSKHHVTKLLIIDVHQSVGHLGQEYVQTSFREKYWILRGRAALWRVFSNCLTCQKQNAAKGLQLMLDLPGNRLIPDKPLFSTVGRDSFGPLRYGVFSLAWLSKQSTLKWPSLSKQNRLFALYADSSAEEGRQRW